MMASNNDISLGNILQHFPEFLIYVLPFITDRIVFNSIASSNKDTNKKSKSIPPPWPIDYQLPASNDESIAVWSPDGTRIAYTRYLTEEIITDGITIVDQRHGIIHRIENNHALEFWSLKFSPDGRFLLSADDDGIVKLWDNNVARNYEQLKDWNISEDIGDDCLLIDISACSKYVVMSAHSRNRVVLISIENGEIIRSLTPQPVMNEIFEVIFSADYCAVFIHGRCGNSSVIKLWRPYLDDVDKDSLITLWEQEDLHFNAQQIVSHDKRMIAIQDTVDPNKGWLLSIDNNYSYSVQKLNVPGSNETVLLQFTSDDEYIIYATKNGLQYLSVAERKCNDKKYAPYNERAMNSLLLVNCSPNNRQLIVLHDNNEEVDWPLYVTSVF